MSRISVERFRYLHLRFNADRVWSKFDKAQRKYSTSEIPERMEQIHEKFVWSSDTVPLSVFRESGDY